MTAVKLPLPAGVVQAPVGASLDASGVARFRVWAPNVHSVELKLISPEARMLPMIPRAFGYHEIELDDLSPGDLYMYRLDGQVDRPDPASRRQPQGVHGPSELLPAIPSAVRTLWPGLDLADYIIYELHVGTFTPEGTFDGIISRLDRLNELGITAVELMPITEFPGNRNWGYDGVYPFAVHHAYGDPLSLLRLSDECHKRGMALVLDVVYNHLGPEGNYLRDFGSYFTGRYHTPWGDAVNFDGSGSDHVRHFFIQSALYWIETCGVDALRLDAVHAIFDQSAYPFLQELADRVHDKANELGRRIYLIAESDLNDARLLHPPAEGGYGLDAQWSDDVHHSLHTLLTGERVGYYQDFGDIEQLAKAYREGWVYTGEYSRYRNRRFGNSPTGLEGKQFVVCAQNHDQVGNRLHGDRLGHLMDFEARKLAAAAVLLSPFVPLLFMGEEYDEVSPFQYFVSHSDADLVEAVRRGRRAEFAHFLSDSEPLDPQSEDTFEQSKLREDLLATDRHESMCRYYRELIRLRKSHPALRTPNKSGTEVSCESTCSTIVIRRTSPEDHAVILLHFGKAPDAVPVGFASGIWAKIFDSSDVQWGGPGAHAIEHLRADGQGSLIVVAAQSCVVYSGRLR